MPFRNKEEGFLDTVTRGFSFLSKLAVGPAFTDKITRLGIRALIYCYVFQPARDQISDNEITLLHGIRFLIMKSHFTVT
jgi:hypothetical protein